MTTWFLHFFFLLAPSVFHTHSQGRLMNELPFTPSPGNILTRVYESLNAFEQKISALDLLDCCKMPTMPPNMASSDNKKGLFQFFSCGLGHLTQIYQIATYVGHHSLRSLSLWGITQQVPTILIRLSSPNTKPPIQPPVSYIARTAKLSQHNFWCYVCSQRLLQCFSVLKGHQ